MRPSHDSETKDLRELQWGAEHLGFGLGVTWPAEEPDFPVADLDAGDVAVSESAAAGIEVAGGGEREGSLPHQAHGLCFGPLRPRQLERLDIRRVRVRH